MPTPLSVWPLSIRLFHWANASLFLATYWLLEGGERYHEWAGYSIAALVVWRIVRGLWPTDHAAFRSFWPTPTRLRRYWAIFPDKSGEFQGHNPLAACMILFLLVALLLTAFTGWLQGTEQFWGEEWLQQSHKWLAHSLMLAVVVHIAAVFIMPHLNGHSVLKKMLWRRQIATAHRERAKS